MIEDYYWTGVHQGAPVVLGDLDRTLTFNEGHCNQFNPMNYLTTYRCTL